jgi:thioredoxin-related protein
MKKCIALAVLLTATFGTSAFLPAPPALAPAEARIEWLTIEQAYERCQRQPRKVLVDVYTDWCGWCKTMDRTTFTNPAVAAYINRTFYAVKLNAEQRGAIRLGDQKFGYIPHGRKGYNELAAGFLGGKMSFPTTVFLDERMALIQPIPGFHKPDAFHRILTYFGGNYHKKQPWEKYEKDTYAKLYSGR